MSTLELHNTLIEIPEVIIITLYYKCGALLQALSGTPRLTMGKTARTCRLPFTEHTVHSVSHLGAALSLHSA